VPAHQQQDHCITQLAFSLSEPPAIKLIVTPYKGGSSHNALSNAGNLHVSLESQVFIQDRTRNLQHEGTEEVVENMQPVNTECCHHTVTDPRRTNIPFHHVT
jgi:hypothetical protein